jgi:hypothetical protein
VRTVITTHAVYGYGNQFDPHRFTIHEPRIAYALHALVTAMFPLGQAAARGGAMPLSCAIGQSKAGECYSPLVLTTFLPR